MLDEEGRPCLCARAAAAAASAHIMGERVEGEAATVEENAAVARGVDCHGAGALARACNRRGGGAENRQNADEDQEGSHVVLSPKLRARYAWRGTASAVGAGAVRPRSR